MRTWVFVCGIIVVSALAVSIYQASASNTQDANERMRAFIASMEERVRENPEEAYAYLKNAVREDTTAAYVAHYVGHIIGRQLYESYGMQGMSVCDDDLIYACLHGFMLAALERGEDPFQVVAACRDYGATRPSDEKQAYAYLVGCVHGLGHSFFTMLDDDLESSLNACEQFVDTEVVLYDEFGAPMLDGVLSCKEGVFMQRAETARPSKELFERDPWSFCAFQESQDRIACARYQGLLAHRILSPTASTITNICESAPEREMKDNCYHEAGFTEALVFENKKLSVPEIIAACSSIDRPQGVYRCTAVSASTYVLEQFPDWSRAARTLCSSLKENSEACTARIKLMSAYISPR